MTRDQLLKVLLETGSLTAASKKVGICRTVLSRMAKRLGINVRRGRPPGGSRESCKGETPKSEETTIDTFHSLKSQFPDRTSFLQYRSKFVNTEAMAVTLGVNHRKLLTFAKNELGVVVGRGRYEPLPLVGDFHIDVHLEDLVPDTGFSKLPRVLRCDVKLPRVRWRKLLESRGFKVEEHTPEEIDRQIYKMITEYVRYRVKMKLRVSGDLYPFDKLYRELGRMQDAEKAFTYIFSDDKWNYDRSRQVLLASTGDYFRIEDIPKDMQSIVKEKIKNREKEEKQRMEFWISNKEPETLSEGLQSIRWSVISNPKDEDLFDVLAEFYVKERNNEDGWVPDVFVRPNINIADYPPAVEPDDKPQVKTVSSLELDL